MIDRTNIQKLLGKLPRAPGADLYNGASANTLDGFSTRTGIVLPKDVRDWLQFTNAPNVGLCTLLGIGVREDADIEAILEFHPEWLRHHWLPIATDGCGNYYVVPTRGDFGEGYPVLFIDTMADHNSPAYIVASSIGRFLEFFFDNQLKDHSFTFDKVGWPFDKDYVTKRDPDIARFKNVRLPWECE